MYLIKPSQLAGQEVLRYVKFRHAFMAHLTSLGLVLEYSIDLTSTMSSLMELVVRDLEESPFDYRFITSLYAQTPLCLLVLVNKGQRRPSDQSIRLRSDYQAMHLTAEQVIASFNKFKFIGIEGQMIVDGRLEIIFRKL